VSKVETVDELRMRVTAEGLAVSEAKQIIECASNEAFAHERRSPQKSNQISLSKVLSGKRESKMKEKNKMT
jgi:uncharacterized protein YoxC